MTEDNITAADIVEPAAEEVYQEIDVFHYDVIDPENIEIDEEEIIGNLEETGILDAFIGSAYAFGALVLNANHPLVQYVLKNKDGENTAKICWQLYDLASLSHGSLSPERMTEFVARSNEIMLLLAGEKAE